MLPRICTDISTGTLLMSIDNHKFLTPVDLRSSEIVRFRIGPHAHF